MALPIRIPVDPYHYYYDFLPGVLKIYFLAVLVSLEISRDKLDYLRKLEIAFQTFTGIALFSVSY